MAQELATPVSPEVAAIAKGVFLLVCDGAALFELRRHRAGLPSDRRGGLGLVLVAAKPDRARGDDQHRDRHCQDGRNPFELVRHHQWNICTVVGW